MKDKAKYRSPDKTKPRNDLPLVLDVPVVGFKFRGEMQAFVVDAKSGKVIKEYPVQKNLLLNRFMESVYDTRINRLFTHAVASIGTKEVAFTDGVSTASQVGTTVTILSGAFTFNSTVNHTAAPGGIIGNVIKFSTGEERRIVAVNGAGPTYTSVEVIATPNTAVAETTFTVYGTNQVQMSDTAGEERAGSGITGTSYLNGECGRIENSSTGAIELFRTYDFKVRTDSLRGAGGGPNVPYKEVGFSDATGLSGANSNMNVRLLLTTPIEVENTQFLRLKYKFICTVSPITSETVSGNPITNWLSAGRQQIQRPMLETIQANGLSQSYITGGSSPLEPTEVTSNAVIASLTVVATNFNGFNTNGPDRFTGPPSATAQQHTISTNGGPALLKTTKQLYSGVNEVSKLSLSKKATWLAGFGNSSGPGWQCIVLGQHNSTTPARGCLEGANQGFVYILDVPNPKVSTHQLDVNFVFTWDRTLA